VLLGSSHLGLGVTNRYLKQRATPGAPNLVHQASRHGVAVKPGFGSEVGIS
jgi:hypothetical protein